ncbi:MAG: UDP-N-acetylmuramoyl-L-alanyl-D-glutamate--2,6-diaminopimelate ligase [Clostridia bacterium]|nr:UDP-N-acetylmuramoyl-L-alanyl-D-glutamate--2,6-diaminopimelate ligase [Clostridia bacterium]
MKIYELLPTALCLQDYQNDSTEFTGVSSHTANIKKGDLFVLIKGNTYNPILLLKQIEQSGARGIVMEWERELPSLSLPVYFVKSARAAEAYLFASLYKGRIERLRLIGVTGTNGKTTTAQLLAHLLSAQTKTGYIGTLGAFLDGKPIVAYSHSTMTTPTPEILYPLLAEMAEAGATTVVLEVSSHAIVQKRLAALSFELALFTNLSEEHLDFHKDMAHYFEAKASFVKEAKSAIINIDDEYGEQLARALPSAYTVGILQEADANATDLNEKGLDGINYTYQSKSLAFPVSLSLIGSFQVYNAMLAIAAALQLGLSPTQIQRRIASFPRPKGRMEVLPLERFSVPFRVIIDYAHTPNAFTASMQAARRLTGGRLVVLFGAGGDREKEKRAEMGRIAERLADFVYITADNSRTEALASIIKDILSGMTLTARRRVITNREKAIQTALSELREGDTLLLLGKGHEAYEWDSAGLHPFSEEEIVYGYLSAMSGN